eukprot:CAMPEP_0204012110 /NCGR_PEP_ID=MMETSP0360-20130528/23776_1 /ASSEMBLY_ACC=CAM_ASM_000342 /TAXON_ID=268821 /ORGANISM="Scrippsiella Hangoei, Strain SHTV-5" /LENGTH=55 /DNA_ID=CAMNT_0050954765 /DNA_START=1 /DNA_END=165 /DNA_ORIENTATION=-
MRGGWLVGAKAGIRLFPAYGSNAANASGVARQQWSRRVAGFGMAIFGISTRAAYG